MTEEGGLPQIKTTIDQNVEMFQDFGPISQKSDRQRSRLLSKRES